MILRGEVIFAIFILNHAERVHTMKLYKGKPSGSIRPSYFITSSDDRQEGVLEIWQEEGLAPFVSAYTGYVIGDLVEYFDGHTTPYTPDSVETLYILEALLNTIKEDYGHPQYLLLDALRDEVIKEYM